MYFLFFPLCGVCIGEYVHFPPLIPSLKYINSGIKLEVVMFYVYVLGIYYVWNNLLCHWSYRHILHIKEQKDEELSKDWKTISRWVYTWNTKGAIYYFVIVVVGSGITSARAVSIVCITLHCLSNNIPYTAAFLFVTQA